MRLFFTRVDKWRLEIIGFSWRIVEGMTLANKNIVKEAAFRTIRKLYYSVIRMINKICDKEIMGGA